MKTTQHPAWNDELWAHKLSPRLLNLHRIWNDKPEETDIKVLINLDSFHSTPEMEVPVLSLLENSITSRVPLGKIEQLALSQEVTHIDLAS